MYFLAKYGVQTDIEFAMVKRGVVDLAATADWTPATGDTKIIKAGANAANTTNNPAAITGTGSISWKLTLTATELQADRIQIQIVDSATKAVEDQFFTVYTYGNVSAKIPLDLSTTIENQVWDAARSSHITTGSMGLTHQSVLRDNTATAGAAGTITLDASAPTTVDIYKSCVVYIYGGTGSGQAPRTITAYSAGRVASVVPNWNTTPDNTSKFIIWAITDMPLVGTDSKSLLSSDAQSGVTIPTVTTLTNAPTDSSGITTLLSRIASALTITSGKIDVNDKTDFDLSIAARQAIWDVLTSALTAVGSVGKWLSDNIDVAISSRSSHSAANVRTEMDSNSTKLANLDAAVTTRLASGTVASDVTAIKAKTDNLPSGIKKNTALNNFQFAMLDSTTEVGKTGLSSFTKEVNIDNAGWTSLSGSVTEIGNGLYRINLTSGELNGDMISLRFAATDAFDTMLTLKTSL